VERVDNKHMSINPIKLSQPMGAHLFFLGIKNCMPLMHGAQGCASFSKVFFTRHFSDPIAVQTTAVNDITAVIDGGDYSISTAIENITKKVKPDVVGLFTTGMTETKGDDIKGATLLLKDKQLIVYTNTPDFEGGLESGYLKAINSTVDQLVEPKESINKKKVLLIPNVNLKPIEIEEIKESLELFGFEVYALPDISESLDGHLGLKQGALSSGGISVDEIKALGDCGLVITVGSSVAESGEKFLAKNSNTTHLHFDSLGGLVNSDNFYGSLLEYLGEQTPPTKVAKWRKRLQDAMLDTHFAIGSTSYIVAGESDEVVSICETIIEAGANIKCVVATTKSEALNSIECDKLIIGDMCDVEENIEDCDVLITNFHGERLAKKYHKGLIVRGFPNYEEVGNQMKNDILYRGSMYFLFEVANLSNHIKGH
jgi:nitrogenase molybdenum-iron protein NifN